MGGRDQGRGAGPRGGRGRQRDHRVRPRHRLRGRRPGRGGPDGAGGRSLLLVADDCDQVVAAVAEQLADLVAGSTGPADRGHVPAAAEHQRGAGAAGAAAGLPGWLSADRGTSSPQPGVCFWTARGRRRRRSGWTRPRRRTSSTSAAAWTGCRWRSSWRPPGSAPLMWPRWPTASPAICSCWSRPPGQAGTGRWPQPSSGPGDFSTTPNGTCWAAWPRCRASSRWRWPRRWLPARASGLPCCGSLTGR